MLIAVIQVLRSTNMRDSSSKLCSFADVIQLVIILPMQRTARIIKIPFGKSIDAISESGDTIFAVAAL